MIFFLEKKKNEQQTQMQHQMHTISSESTSHKMNEKKKNNKILILKWQERGHTMQNTDQFPNCKSISNSKVSEIELQTNKVEKTRHKTSDLTLKFEFKH